VHFPHSFVRRFALPLTILVTLLAGFTGPAGAVDPAPTTITLSAPASGKAGLPAPFTITLTDNAAAPLAGAPVSLQRTGGTPISGTTTANGTVVINAVLPVGSSTWKASYAGDTTHAPSTSQVVTVVGQRYASTVQLTGPSRIVDERAGTLSVVWTAADASAIKGTVAIQVKRGSAAWTSYKRVATSSAGRATLGIKPRVDTQWRAVGLAGPWWLADTSNVLAVDNVPPVAPVAYPKAAPRPRATPMQPRASGAGAHAVINAIPASVWKSMKGRSWHSGCPVGRSGLRLLRINYWGFDGYRRRGEMVLSAAVATRAAAALRDMYNGHYPIRRMYRVDRFGWSKKLHGANDYASMAADNTSAFNCRSVVNKPSVLSPHARGRAVDINTWENPYRSATGLVPNTWWASHSHPLIAWRSSSHPVVRIWRKHGFRWTYGNVDSQHVDGRQQGLSGSFTG
jgi:Big-like domain-containing protein/D-alanyl-D-alanine carboxypeptidase-like protein